MSDDSNTDNEKGFTVPEKYFENAARTLAEKIQAREELSPYPALLALKGSQPFKVPENYFEAGTMEISAYPALSSLDKSSAFTVPSGYFTAAAETIYESAVFAVLASTRKNGTGFSVPPAYHDGNSERLQQLLIPPPKARIIRMPVLISAAATLLIVLGVWYYRYLSPASTQDCGTIACLDREQLLKNKVVENADVEDLYDLIDANALEQKLEAVPAVDDKPEADHRKNDSVRTP